MRLVFACQCMQPGVCNIGAPCASQTSCDDGQHGTCEATMWHAFNDNTCIPSNHSGHDPVAAGGPRRGAQGPFASAFALATLALGRLRRRRRVCAGDVLGRH